MAARTFLVLVLLAGMALAQTPQPVPPLNTVNVTFTASGTYTVDDQTTAILTGSGQFTLLGAVVFNATVQATSPGRCTVFFNIYPNQGGANTTTSPYIAALGRDLPCATDNPLDGLDSQAVAIWGGQVSAGGTQTTQIHGGYLTFGLAAFDFNWNISGQGEINLVPAAAKTAGPGGSGYPAVADGPGGSGYPIVINGANAGSVLVFNGTTSDASSTASFNPHAATGPSSILIPIPVQSVASSYTVSADCGSSAASCWIEVPTASGSIAANSSATVSASVNAQELNPGVYPAVVAIAITPASSSGGGPSSPTTINLPLTAIVAPGADMLGISESGLQFQAIAGAQAQSQSISISALGAGSLPFSVSSSEAAGESWLSVFPGATTTTATPVPAEIGANPAGLVPGTYFGRVDVSAPGAINAPQSIDVSLTVLPASSNSSPVLSPAVLTFSANSNGNPAPQTIQISNLSNQQLALAETTFTSDGANWLNVSPTQGTATAAQPLTESVTVQPKGLAPGVYNGTVVFQNANDNSTYPVAVQLVVPKSAPCTPTQLLPVITNLGAGFETTAALPVPLQAQIVDDCGTPLTAGSVTAFFSSGDPVVSMLPTGNGQWQGTWLPHSIAGGGVAVTLSASSYTAALSGSTTTVGIISANATAPVVNQAGVVSAAAPTTHLPVAPGGLISIFGSNLATARASASSLPLPTVLADTQVLLGGKALPLEFTSSGQINAVVPYGAPVNAIQQLTVIQNGIYSPLETLVVVPAEPAIFTQDQSGTGAGVIFVVKPGGTPFLNTATAPASAGDALEIYCAGLGAVNPPVPDGAAAPASPPAHTIIPVTVTIAGQTAPVSFAGLVPGFAGLYQVNVTVPGGIKPASDVPLVVTAGTASSPTVTLAIQ